MCSNTTMWLFTRYGFFSIACASSPDGALDSDTLMIRSRRKAHLEKLQARFPQLANIEVSATRHTDYRYRMIVAKSDWVAVVAELAGEQTWSNFKSEVARFGGCDDYERALHRVWEVMHTVQLSEEGS